MSLLKYQILTEIIKNYLIDEKLIGMLFVLPTHDRQEEENAIISD